MTDHDHDLCDLIAELDALHGPGPEGEAGYCAECNCFNAEGSGVDYRPCPCSTMQIVDKYKRRAHRRKYIIHAAVDPAYPTDKPQLMQLAVTEKPHGRIIHYFETLTQADAWIEQQYEENQ